MKARLRVLSPLHIGSGEEASPLDYFIDGSDFCRLNMDGLFTDTDFTSQMRDKFLQVAGSQRYIGGQLPKNLLKRHISYRIPVAGKARTQLCSTTETGKTVVKTFVKSAGRVYVPGSSLKGGLLSALCWRILLAGWNSGRPEAKQDIGDLLTRGRTQENDGLLDVVLSRLGGRGTKSFTHWLDVTDSDLKSPSECLEVSLARVQDALGRSEIPILCETLKPGSEFALTLVLDPASKVKPDELLATVNDFYQRVHKADDPRASRPPAQNGLVRLGQGSGAYAVSLLVLALELGLDRQYRIRSPRTRKRVDDVFAMGWAQLTNEQ